MKYCTFCGAQLPDNAIFCVNCGRPTVPFRQMPVDRESTALNVLSFFLPLVGLICYLVFANTQPIKAHGCGRFALIGFLAGIAFRVLLVSALFSILF